MVDFSPFLWWPSISYAMHLLYFHHATNIKWEVVCLDYSIALGS